MKQPWHHNPFLDLINFTKDVNIHAFSMNVIDFADVRMFGRDYLDIDDRSYRIFDIPIRYDDGSIEQDVLLALDNSGSVISHAVRREYLEGEDPFIFHLGYFRHDQLRVCVLCAVQQVMDL